MKEQDRLILSAIDAMEALNPAQLRRLLFESGLTRAFDLTWPLATLREEGYLSQTVGESGIMYILTDQGRAALEAEPLPDTVRSDLHAKAEEYRVLFAKEKNYLAQYSEQANGIIPVFLSIRQNDKVLFKISVIVKDVETAERIKRDWMANAHRTFEQTWHCIAPGMPLPVFD